MLVASELRSAAVAKDFKRLRKEAEEQGWRVEQTKNGHWAFYAPDGKNIVHVGGTPRSAGRSTTP
jgi:hypothetical protein